MFDMSGATMANMDVAGMRSVLGLLSTHYVERLAALYFYDPPRVFFGLWNASKHLVPEVGGLFRVGGVSVFFCFARGRAARRRQRAEAPAPAPGQRSRAPPSHPPPTPSPAPSPRRHPRRPPPPPR